MSGDLLTLRMMVVSAAEAVRDQWRDGAALASMPIEYGAADAAEALRGLSRDGFDIVLLDAALPIEERHGLVAAVTAVQPRPLLAVSADRGAPHLEGANLMLPNPTSEHEARAG